jgi:hypothetical protein
MRTTLLALALLGAFSLDASASLTGRSSAGVSRKRTNVSRAGANEPFRDIGGFAGHQTPAPKATPAAVKPSAPQKAPRRAFDPREPFRSIGRFGGC